MGTLGFRIAGTASNGKAALSLARKCGMDLIITDISMPEMDGFDFIEAVLAEFPDTYIIIISSYADFDYAWRAMKDGISDYILKNDISAESLASHLKKVKEYLDNQAQKTFQFQIRINRILYCGRSSESCTGEILPYSLHLSFLLWLDSP